MGGPYRRTYRGVRWLVPWPMRVIAHRTLPQHCPENSLEGIALARTLGADAVEIDVRRSADGVAIMNHDVTAWRVARWPLPIRWTRRAASRGLRRRDGGGRLVTLREALASLPPDLGVNIDVKSPDALARPRSTRWAAAT